MENLNSYVDAFGNKLDGFYFIAARFKVPVYWEKNIRNFDISLLSPPCVVVLEDRRKVVVDSRIKTFKFPTEDEESMLLSFFEFFKIKKKIFSQNTLFVQATGDPFGMKRLAKTSTFRTLVRLCTSSKLTLEDVANFRHFKTNTKKICTSWRDWYPFVRHCIYRSYYATIQESPSVSVSKQVHNILSVIGNNEIISPVPPKFYVCEVTLDENALTGVYFKMEHHKKEVVYVSPMVSVLQNEVFLDPNRQENEWLPLFRNRDTWLREGLLYYCQNRPNSSKMLALVILWLWKNGSCEKHRYMLEDFKVVRYCLLISMQDLVQENGIFKECLDALRKW